MKAIFAKAKEAKQLVMVEGADHVFTRKRKALVKIVTDWLDANQG